MNGSDLLSSKVKLLQLQRVCLMRLPNTIPVSKSQRSNVATLRPAFTLFNGFGLIRTDDPTGLDRDTAFSAPHLCSSTKPSSAVFYGVVQHRVMDEDLFQVVTVQT